MADHEIDRLAVQRDAALVHALATRAVPPSDVDLDDPIVTYLAAWVDWVDAGATEGTAFELAEHKDRVVAVTSKRHRTALIAGSTIAALVVTSGAAAAVTGDPFIVAKAPLSVIDKINPFDNDGDARDRLPDHAPDVADANKLLADAQRAMASGDTEEAERLVAEATALLGEGANPGQQSRIDKLIEDIEVGSTKTPGSDGGDPSDGHGDNGNQPDKGDDGRPVKGEHGKPDKDTSPADHDPVDKDPNGDKPHDNDPVDNDPQGGADNGSAGESGGTGGQGSGQGDQDSARQPKGDNTSGKSGRSSGDKASGHDKADQDKPVKDRSHG